MHLNLREPGIPYTNYHAAQFFWGVYGETLDSGLFCLGLRATLQPVGLFPKFSRVALHKQELVYIQEV